MRSSSPRASLILAPTCTRLRGSVQAFAWHPTLARRARTSVGFAKVAAGDQLSISSRPTERVSPLSRLRSVGSPMGWTLRPKPCSGSLRNKACAGRRPAIKRSARAYWSDLLHPPPEPGRTQNQRESVGKRNSSFVQTWMEGNGQPAALRDYILLEQVPGLLPTQPSRATVFRWAQLGVAGVKLRLVSVGATRCTTEAWLSSFFEGIEKARRTTAPIAARTKRGRRRSRLPRQIDAGDRTTETLRRFRVTT